MYPPRSEYLDDDVSEAVFGDFSFKCEDTTYFDFKVKAKRAIEEPVRSEDGYCTKIKVFCSSKKDGSDKVKSNVDAGYFYLQQYPFNCGMLIVAGMGTNLFYKRGLGTRMLRAVEMIAIDCGYSHLSASTNGAMGNLAFNKMALRAGWKEVDTFRNKRSGSTISVITKDIRQGE